MQNDCISRKALLARYDAEHVGPPGRARELIVTAPAVDMVPVVHGEPTEHMHELLQAKKERGKTMKTYTQVDFDTFEVDKFGRKICPTGDYTNIKGFVEYCVFDRHCLFGAQSRFIEHCRFGDGCYFGDGCSFGAYCYFGSGCEFGKECHFGELCGFGEGGTFGEGCSFGEWCTFGEWCNFGEYCNYENDKVKNGRYVAVDRIGSANRKAYFYTDDNGNMFVRAGCWFSDMAAFKERVKKVHAGTIHEKTYLAACDLAELMLKGGNGK